jgi:hypothetical protein
MDISATVHTIYILLSQHTGFVLGFHYCAIFPCTISSHIVPIQDFLSTPHRSSQPALCPYYALSCVKAHDKPQNLSFESISQSRAYQIYLLLGV